MGWLALLFTVVPLVDLWLLLVIGEWLGFWPTVWATILIAVVGAYLGKREGLRLLGELRSALAELRMPEEGLVSGALVLVGAALLIAPGVISDTLGLALLFPPTRKPIARLVRARLEKRFSKAVAQGRVRVQVSSFGSVVSSSVDERVEVVDVEAEPVDEASPKLLGPHG